MLNESRDRWKTIIVGSNAQLYWKSVFGTMPEPFCVHGINRLAQKILFPVENIPLSLSAVSAKHIIANRVLRNFVPS